MTAMCTLPITTPMPNLRPLPLPPQTQALTSTTFHPPPLDGSLTLPEVYDWHARHSPNHRVFVFANDKGETTTIYWPEAVRAIRVGASIMRQRVGWRSGMNPTPVVAILSSSDTIPYFCTNMSVIYANLIVFPISPRNSPAAIAYLISQTGVQHVLVGREQVMQDLIREAFKVLHKEYPSIREPATSFMPIFEELFLPESKAPTPEELIYEPPDSDTNAIILHSSGSTAFPKPIYWTSHRLSQLSLIPWYGERDLTDQVFSLHVMPMFHGMGVLQLCWVPSCGLVVSAFEPKSPPPVPTPDSLFIAAKACNADIILCVPSFIEQWADKPECISWLATRTGVLYGGGPLNKEAGDLMTSHGVSIFILYGSTEGGIMSPVLPARVDYDWNYFYFPDNITPHMVPYADNTFEFVMLENESCRPSIINTKINGIDSYATSDLLIPHPTKEGYWCVYGRTDDQIMHNTGEKTNPSPLESMLNQDPHVLSSVMFGRGRFQAGLLIDPKPQFQFDPTDQIKLADFRNKIWLTVERINEFAPQHSRLFKEMIIVASPTKPFTYTAKSTPRRQAVINDYQEEIDALYDAVEESTQTSIPPPVLWDLNPTIGFVRKVVESVMVSTVSDEDDLFQHGCDSLQATWIRNSILRALRDSIDLDTRKIVSNFVYEHPTITSLSRYVSGLALGIGGGDFSSKASDMRSMAEKYSQDFPLHKAIISSQSNGAVVLVTGTTGGLGCYILSQLVSAQDVSRVYAFNRKSRDAKSLYDRQKSALIDRGLNPCILESKKVVLVEGDTAFPGFGLSHTAFQEMQQLVTHIIHNAWRVDFNLALTSFESNIRGLRNLVDFALSSPLSEPARIIYTSSIGVFQNSQPDSKPIPETHIEPELSIGTGYTESKWVSERILSMATSKTGLKTLSVRVGQLCGGLNGAWNASDWVPALVQSALTLKCIPSDDKDVSWIPLHHAASALVDFLKHSPTPNSQVVHLVHPRPVSWSQLAEFLSREFSVPLVPYTVWLAKLEEATVSISQGSSQEDTQNEVDMLTNVRALRLLPFFKDIATKEKSSNAMGFPALEFKQATAASTTLADPAFPQLDADDVRRWLAYWRNVKLLPAA